MASSIYEKLKHTHRLPSPAGVALEILRLAGDETATTDSIAKAVESDPAMAARLLKMANSPFAGVSRTVASVSMAVRLLGLRTVKNFAISFSLLANHQEGRCRMFGYERFWSESLGRATAARALAQHLNEFPADEAFTIGLLSQIGQLGLATAYAEEYAELLARAVAGEPAQLLTAERDLFGFDHHQLAAEMAADWGLQEVFCNAMRQQHPSQSEAGDGRGAGRAHPQPARFADLLRLAQSIAGVLIETEVLPESVATLLSDAAKVGIAPDALDRLFDSVRDEWRETGAIFSVTTHEVPSLERIRAQTMAKQGLADTRFSEPPAPEAAASPARPGLRVLMVDDDPTALRLLNRYLTGAGYQVLEATCAEEALGIVRAQAPDMILTDWMMPELDGLELCRRLRAEEAAGFVYMIMVTANSRKEQLIEALNAGADDFLSKPYSREELLARVRAGERVVRLQADLSSRNDVVWEQARAQEVLLELSCALTSAASLEVILDRVISAAIELTACQRVSIMLPDSTGESLVIARSAGVAEEVAAAIRVPIGSAIAGRAFLSDRPVVRNAPEAASSQSDRYDSPFFLSTPLISQALRAPNRVVGVLNITEQRVPRPFTDAELRYINLLCNLAATVISNFLNRQACDEARDSIVAALATLVEYRDADTGHHLERVTRYALLLAEELRTHEAAAGQINESFLQALRQGMPLHDIGKVAVPDHILLKPGQLSPAERTVMQGHAALGADTIRAIAQRVRGTGFLELAEQIAHGHHERYDGGGYPRGLKGDTIPLAARIAAVADAFDALTSQRPYKAASPPAVATDIIRRASGSQFDPVIVAAFLRREQEFAMVALQLADRQDDEPLVEPGRPRDTVTEPAVAAR